MSEMIKVHFEPKTLGVSHFVCGACGCVWPEWADRYVWDGLGHFVPECPTCPNTDVGVDFHLNKDVLEIDVPIINLRKYIPKKGVFTWIDISPEEGKIIDKTRKRVRVDDAVINAKQTVAKRERQLITGKEDMSEHVINTLVNIIEILGDIKIRLGVVRVLENSRSIHAIKHVGAWHGDPGRGIRKGFDGKFVNVGMWLNAMEGDFRMFDVAIESAIKSYEFWSGAAKRSHKAWVKRRAQREYERANSLVEYKEALVKAGYMSMNRGTEFLDPASCSPRYIRWYDPNEDKVVATGIYGEHRIVRYIDEMGDDDGQDLSDSFARPRPKNNNDETTVTNEDIE